MNKTAQEGALAGIPMTHRAAFTSPTTHPLVLGLLMLQEFGVEYLAWEAETCWSEINQTWGTTVSEVNRNKIQAVRTCYVQESPYMKWEVFEDVALALNGVVPQFDVLQAPAPAHLAAAIDVMLRIREKYVLSEQVYRYCTASLLNSGVAWGPGSLEPCNQFLRPFVGDELQRRVERAVVQGAVPKFDGTANDDDTQIMKSLTIKDYCTFMSAQLRHQLQVLSLA